MGSPLAVAVICSVCGPVRRPLSTSVAVNVADVDPAAIVTVAGSVNWVVSLELSDTTSGAVSVPPSCTVPESVCPSHPEAGSVTVIVRSSSMMLTVAEPSVQFSTCEVTVTGVSPDSMMWSSRSVAVKLTDIWSASNVTVAGTVSRIVSLEVNSTVMFRAGAALEITVPMIVPPVSWAVSGRLMVITAVW